MCSFSSCWITFMGYLRRQPLFPTLPARGGGGRVALSRRRIRQSHGFVTLSGGLSCHLYMPPKDPAVALGSGARLPPAAKHRLCDGLRRSARPEWRGLPTSAAG